MALVGNAVSTQIIRLPTFNWPWQRNRTAVTTGCWLYFPSVLYDIRSFWRMDGTMTMAQTDNGQVRGIVWLQDFSRDLGTFYEPGAATHPVGQWVFVCMVARNSALRLHRYIPATGALNVNAFSNAFTSIYASHGVNPMVVGGTEGNGELIEVGQSVAELSVLNIALSEQAVRQFAHEPQAFQQHMVLHAPLRDSRASATALVNGVRHPFVFNSTARQQISATNHPQVERWREKRSFVSLANTAANRLIAADALRMRASTAGSSLTVRLG